MFRGFICVHFICQQIRRNVESQARTVVLQVASFVEEVVLRWHVNVDSSVDVKAKFVR